MAIKTVLILLLFISCSCFGQKKNLIEGEGSALPIRVITSPVDSSKIYWKKKVLYEALFNQEMERINNLKNPKLTKKALRFQDSTIKYELLLNKLSNGKYNP